MLLTKEELQKQLEELADNEGLYLNEAQFQFELAGKLRDYFAIQNRECHIYLEYPSTQKDNTGRRQYYDIVIQENNAYCVIELKYKTKKGKINYDGIVVELKYHAAQPLAKFDFLKDVSRIENFEKDTDKKLDCGFVIMLTNDKSYWERDSKDGLAQEFSLMDGTTICKGCKKWRPDTKTSSVGESRKDGLKLQKDYEVVWKPYCENFKYLMLEIK